MPGTSVQKGASAPQVGAPQVPSAPPPPALPQASSLPALNQQFTQLQVQLAGLSAEWSGLSRQLESMRIDNPARPPVQAKAADVGVQMAQLRGQMATIQAQINILEHSGFPAARGPHLPRGNGRPPMDPDAVTAIVIVFTLAVLMPLSIGIARRLWRRGSKSDAPAHDPMIAPRLDRLEQAVDAIAIEIERVSEGQRFVTKILAERPAASVIDRGASESAAAYAEPQIRALGAGPIEPVRVAERQSVRASNTPH
jgi:hypothetical protein